MLALICTVLLNSYWQILISIYRQSKLIWNKEIRKILANSEKNNVNSENEEYINKIGTKINFFPLLGTGLKS
jgi:hypothetical protein